MRSFGRRQRGAIVWSYRRDLIALHKHVQTLHPVTVDPPRKWVEARKRQLPRAPKADVDGAWAFVPRIEGTFDYQLLAQYQTRSSRLFVRSVTSIASRQNSGARLLAAKRAACGKAALPLRSKKSRSKRRRS